MKEGDEEKNKTVANERGVKSKLTYPLANGEMNQQKGLKDHDDDEEGCKEILNQKATNRRLKELQSFSNLVLFFFVRKIFVMTAMAMSVTTESRQLELLLYHEGGDADLNKQ